MKARPARSLQRRAPPPNPLWLARGLTNRLHTAQAGAEIPFDDTHLHFGKGQTEAAVTLSPGKHKLTLQFANALHKRCACRGGFANALWLTVPLRCSYGKGYSKTITVNVK